MFPRARVRAALEDTHIVKGHQVAAMPNWRDVLRRTERANERTISIRLEALISHLEALQK